jgi:hypothetical protein
MRKDVTGAVFSDWHRVHSEVRLGTFQEAAAFSEVIVNATNGSASLDALALAGGGESERKDPHRHLEPAGLLAGHAPVPVRLQH